MKAAISVSESERIDAVRFPLIFFVIYIHARSSVVNFEDGQRSLDYGTVELIKLAISDGMARSAVPMFFTLSGYFLFYGQKQWSWLKFSEKFNKRINTLVIPFLFWNILLFFVLLIAQSTPLKVFFNGGGFLAEMPWQTQAALVLGLQRYPISYQFWFIRDLIVLVASAPIWFLLARRTWLAGSTIGLLGICWMADWWPISIPAIEAILFFFLGMTLGMRKKSLLQGPPLAFIGLFYVGLLIIFLLLHRSVAGSAIQHVLVATGVVLAFGIVRNLPVRMIRPLVALSGASFFVFAFHEPLTTVLLKLSYRIFPISAATVSAIYLLVPVVVTLIALFLYQVAMTLVPTFTRYVTGR